MKILVDAFNLIYKFPDLELCMYEDRLDEAKEGLFGILERVLKVQPNLEFMVFVDGKKAKGDYDTWQEERKGLKIFYSQEKEADDLIRECIKENPYPNKLTLVTSDKKILQFARQFKVKYHTSEDFSERIQEILEPDSKNSDPDYKPIPQNLDAEIWWNTFISS
jgi:predicted RNA-binding protein with PIN domain